MMTRMRCLDTIQAKFLGKIELAEARGRTLLVETKQGFYWALGGLTAIAAIADMT